MESNKTINKSNNTNTEQKRTIEEKEKISKEIREWIKIALDIVKIIIGIFALYGAFTILVTNISVRNSQIADISGNNNSVNYGIQDFSEYNTTLNEYIRNEIPDELSQANLYMISGDYEAAKIIYEKEEYSSNQAVLINLGYICEF